MNNEDLTDMDQGIERKPPWLRRRLPSGPRYEQTRRLLSRQGLHTVCQEANCPNMFECFSQHTATFLILGDRCTRACTFCNVRHGRPEAPDFQEPVHVAQAAAQMGLTYVVVTSVTRDDLPDGGAAVFAATIKALKNKIEDVRIEVLIPDFQGNATALSTVLDAGPDVLNHNIETVPRLYPFVRPQADYQRSLSLLRRAGRYPSAIPTKSGIMLGLGETEDEIRQTLADLRKTGCGIVTIGQYLRPGPHHHPVERYVTPREFRHWRRIALEMGFGEAASEPFVRSSYHAHEAFKKICEPSAPAPSDSRPKKS